MAKATAFTLSGKSFDISAIGNAVPTAAKYLDKLPHGTLLKSRELAAAIGRNSSAFLKKSEELSGYWIHSGTVVLWGSKKTIAAAEAILGNNS